MTDPTTMLPTARVTAVEPPFVQLQRALAHRIAIGVYPPGTKLPSVRDLAATVGLNRNTVSKVYKEMARGNWVRAIRGKGVFVTAAPRAEENKALIADQIVQSVQNLSHQARVWGLSHEEVLALIVEAVDQTYGRRTVRVACVECNEYDAEALAQDLEVYLGTSVDRVVMSELKSMPEVFGRKFDLLCTNFFHLAEMRQLLPRHCDKLVGLQISPRPEVVLRLASYGVEHRLGLLVSSETTMNSLTELVRMHSAAAVIGAIDSDANAAGKVLELSDAIVDTLRTHDLAERLAPDKPKITVTYHVHSQSREYLRHRVAECLKQRVAERHANAVRRQP